MQILPYTQRKTRSSSTLVNRHPQLQSLFFFLSVISCCSFIRLDAMLWHSMAYLLSFCSSTISTAACLSHAGILRGGGGPIVAAVKHFCTWPLTRRATAGSGAPRSRVQRIKSNKRRIYNLQAKKKQRFSVFSLGFTFRP